MTAPQSPDTVNLIAQSMSTTNWLTDNQKETDKKVQSQSTEIKEENPQLQKTLQPDWYEQIKTGLNEAFDWGAEQVPHNSSQLESTTHELQILNLPKVK